MTTPRLARDLRQRRRRRPRDRLGEIEVGVILGLAEVLACGTARAGRPPARRALRGLAHPRRRARSRLSAGSVEQRIWTRPSVNVGGRRPCAYYCRRARRTSIDVCVTRRRVEASDRRCCGAGDPRPGAPRRRSARCRRGSARRRRRRWRRARSRRPRAPRRRSARRRARSGTAARSAASRGGTPGCGQSGVEARCTAPGGRSNVSPCQCSTISCARRPASAGSRSAPKKSTGPQPTSRASTAAPSAARRVFG